MSTIYGRIAGLQVSTHAGPKVEGRDSRLLVQLTSLDGSGETVLTMNEGYILGVVLSCINLGLSADTTASILALEPDWKAGGQ